MKVLVLGSRGMLGRQLVEVFGNFDLTSWDREEINIVDGLQVTKKISALRPELIINAAAYTDVDGAESHRDDAFAVNETGVKNIALVAKGLGARLVHFSTDYIFPGDRESGYAEDDEPGPPVNAYGDSKLAGEKALAEIGLDYFLIRTAWLYGSGGKNFVDTMLRLGKERDELKVVDDQHGSPTYTKDLARATRVIVEGDYGPGIYHAVNAGQTTWCEFAREIFRQANLKVKVEAIASEEYPLPAARPSYSVLLNTKGPKLRPWQDALGESLTEN